MYGKNRERARRRFAMSLDFPLAGLIGENCRAGE